MKEAPRLRTIASVFPALFLSPNRLQQVRTLKDFEFLCGHARYPLRLPLI